jgi:hypothetical protein
MTHKKKCKCGWIASGTTAKATGEAIKEHCDYKGCEALEAKNV